MSVLTLADVELMMIVLWQHEQLGMEVGGSPVRAAANTPEPDVVSVPRTMKWRFCLAGAITNDPERSPFKGGHRVWATVPGKREEPWKLMRPLLIRVHQGWSIGFINEYRVAHRVTSSTFLANTVWPEMLLHRVALCVSMGGNGGVGLPLATVGCRGCRGRQRVKEGAGKGRRGGERALGQQA